MDLYWETGMYVCIFKPSGHCMHVCMYVCMYVYMYEYFLCTLYMYVYVCTYMQMNTVYNTHMQRTTADRTCDISKTLDTIIGRKKLLFCRINAFQFSSLHHRYAFIFNSMYTCFVNISMYVCMHVYTYVYILIVCIHLSILLSPIDTPGKVSNIHSVHTYIHTYGT